MRLKLIGILSLLCLTGCTAKTAQPVQCETAGNNVMEYSNRVRITDYHGFDLVEVFPAAEDSQSFRFVLVPDSVETPPDTGFGIIRIPVRSMVCFSSTQLSMIQDDCDKDKVAGILESDYVLNPYFRKRIDSGLVADVGLESNYNVEKIVSLSPDIVLYSLYPNFNSEPLEKCNSTLFPWADYLEQHPLGRAEWLRVMGRLLGRKEAYDSIFFAIGERYNSLIQPAGDGPTIFSDIAFSGQWYVPGGNSYIARIIADAGGNYVWKDNPSSSSILQSPEAIIAKAGEADFWRITHSSKELLTYSKLLKQNSLYGQFKAFREQNILVCNTFETSYFETSILHPELILADFIYHFHRDALTGGWADYEPTYYHRLDK